MRFVIHGMSEARDLADSSAARSHRNTFAALQLERAAEHRDDGEWLAAQRASPQARFVIFDVEGRAPVREDRLLFLPADAVAPETPEGRRCGVRTSIRRWPASSSQVSRWKKQCAAKCLKRPAWRFWTAITTLRSPGRFPLR
jgi:hypothetical protein